MKHEIRQIVVIPILKQNLPKELRSILHNSTYILYKDINLISTQLQVSYVLANRTQIELFMSTRLIFFFGWGGVLAIKGITGVIRQDFHIF